MREEEKYSRKVMVAPADLTALWMVEALRIGFIGGRLQSTYTELN